MESGATNDEAGPFYIRSWARGKNGKGKLSREFPDVSSL